MGTASPPDKRIPLYLGRVLNGEDEPIGTCFQLAPGLIATAWHILDGIGAGEVGAEARLDVLADSSPARQATVRAIDALADIALLETDQPFEACVEGFSPTDTETIGRQVVVTGVPEVDDPGHVYRYLDAKGEWVGGTTRDDGVPLGRMQSTDLMPGMSGAPVRRRDDELVIGVVSGRYTSTDGWLTGTVWVARSEQLEALCSGITPLAMVNSAASQPLEMTLTVDEVSVRLHGGGADVSAPHAGIRPALVGAMEEVRRARTKIGGARRRPGAEPEAEIGTHLTRVGELLGESFLPDPVARALKSALERADHGHQALHLGIACDAELSGLPWGTLPDPRSAQPLALNSLVRVYRRFPDAPAASAPGPLRILVAISSPETGGGAVLDYEQELKNVLAAVRTARQGKAHVRIVPFATTAAIREALETERAHVLHISGHGVPGRLVFEDDDGKARELDADAFVEEAIPPGAMPIVMALSACHSNAGSAALGTSFATRLIERGASVVIATETSLTDVYATRVFSRTYGRLAEAGVPDAVGAACDARRMVQAELESAAEEKERRLGAFHEWSVLSVTAGSGSVAVLDPDAIEPVSPPPPRFTIGSVTARAVGDFVGRRREQRQWPIELVAEGGAGLILHGIGGVGKTTLAAELAGRVLEREPSRASFVIAGPITLDHLLSVITSTLRRKALVTNQLQGPLAEALALAARSDISTTDRLALLREHVLGSIPLLAILDNFEDNLTRSEGMATVTEPPLAELLANWVSDPGASRLLITCRYPFALPEAAEERLALKSVGPLSEAETGKLVWSLPALDRLTPAEVDRVWRLVGGHPRSLEYLDALLSKGAGRYPDITKRLKAAVTAQLGDQKASELLAADWKLDDAVAEVATIASDDVLLPQLLQGLDSTEGGRDLLVGLSVYRVPIDLNGVLYQVGEVDESAESIPDHAGAVQQIEEILAQSGLSMDSVSLDALPADLREEITPHLEEGRRKPLPPRTAPDGLEGMIAACVDSSLLSVMDGPAGKQLFVHRWTASEIVRGAEAEDLTKIEAAHVKAGEYWLWRARFWPQQRRDGVRDLLEARYHFFAAGHAEFAGEVTEEACSALDDLGAWDDEEALVHDTLSRLPEDSDRRAVWLGQLGTLTYRRGNLEEAERLTRLSLELKREKDDLIGMASSYHMLGIITQDRGELEDSEALYHRSLEIEKKLDNQQGIASSYHQLGTLAQEQGELDKAETLYRRSLEIEEKLGDQSGIAGSYHQLGTLAQARGNLQEAERLYNESLRIGERIGARADLASTYHQLGIVAQRRGELNEAEEHYRRSLEIEEELDNLAGIASSFHQLGMLAEDRDDPEEAEGLYRRALEIYKRLGSLSGTARSVHQLGTLAQARGDLDEAEAHFKRSLELEEHLGNQPGVASSYGQLGLLAHERGELDVAEAYYHRSIEIRQRLRDRGGLVTNYGQLGSLAQTRGELDEAERNFRRSLELAQESDNHPAAARALSRLGLVESERGNVTASIPLHAQAFLIRIGISPRAASIDLVQLAKHREEIGKDEMKRALEASVGEEHAGAIEDLLERAAAEEG